MKLYIYMLLSLGCFGLRDPFANMKFDDDCETMKKKNPDQKIQCPKEGDSNTDNLLASLENQTKILKNGSSKEGDKQKNTDDNFDVSSMTGDIEMALKSLNNGSDKKPGNMDGEKMSDVDSKLDDLLKLDLDPIPNKKDDPKKGASDQKNSTQTAPKNDVLSGVSGILGDTKSNDMLASLSDLGKNDAKSVDLLASLNGKSDSKPSSSLSLNKLDAKISEPSNPPQKIQNTFMQTNQASTDETPKDSSSNSQSPSDILNVLAGVGDSKNTLLNLSSDLSSTDDPFKKLDEDYPSKKKDSVVQQTPTVKENIKSESTPIVPQKKEEEKQVEKKEETSQAAFDLMKSMNKDDSKVDAQKSLTSDVLDNMQSSLSTNLSAVSNSNSLENPFESSKPKDQPKQIPTEASKEISKEPVQVIENTQKSLSQEAQPQKKEEIDSNQQKNSKIQDNSSIKIQEDIPKKQENSQNSLQKQNKESNLFDNTIDNNLFEQNINNNSNNVKQNESININYDKPINDQSRFKELQDKQNKRVDDLEKNQNDFLQMLANSTTKQDLHLLNDTISQEINDIKSNLSNQIKDMKLPTTGILFYQEFDKKFDGIQTNIQTYMQKLLRFQNRYEDNMGTIKKVFQTHQENLSQIKQDQEQIQSKEKEFSSNKQDIQQMQEKFLQQQKQQDEKMQLLEKKIKTLQRKSKKDVITLFQIKKVIRKSKHNATKQFVKMNAKLKEMQQNNHGKSINLDKDKNDIQSEVVKILQKQINKQEKPQDKFQEMRFAQQIESTIDKKFQENNLQQIIQQQIKDEIFQKNQEIQAKQDLKLDKLITLFTKKLN